MTTAVLQRNLHRRTSQLLFGLFVLLAAMMVGPGTSLAEPAAPNEVRSYCLEKAPDSYTAAIRACRDLANISNIRAAASWHCRSENVDDDSMEKCITRESKELVDKALAKRPRATSESRFVKDILNPILKADAESNGGKFGEAAPESKVGKSPTATTCDPDSKDCITSTVDPALCAAAEEAKKENDTVVIPAGCTSNTDAPCSAGGCDLVNKYVNPLIDLLSIAFGLIAVISLILGGIQYASSAGDSQKVTLAKKRIGMTLIAIAAYAFLYGFLDFLIPGGLFR